MSRKKLIGIIVPCVIAIIVVIVVINLREPIPQESMPLAQNYTLITNSSPSGAGSVSPSGGKYESGFQITLTATPASNYTFDYWQGDASGSLTTITITMDSDKSITAHFSVVDTTPPMISAVEVSDITEESAVITWTTDEPATSEVEYGQTLPYDRTTALNENLVINHRVYLNLGMPLASWHFRVISIDKAGNEAISADFFFRTGLPAYLPITHNIEFTSIDNANIEWTAGVITAAEGSQFSVNAGALHMENDEPYYLYYQLNDPDLKHTQTFSDTTPAERFLIAIVMRQ